MLLPTAAMVAVYLTGRMGSGAQISESDPRAVWATRTAQEVCRAQRNERLSAKRLGELAEVKMLQNRSKTFSIGNNSMLRPDL